MSKCIRCGSESWGRGICRSCMNDWKNMRSEIFNALSLKFGKLTPTNHELFKKEMKRMESIWRKDKEKYQSELSKIKEEQK